MPHSSITCSSGSSIVTGTSRRRHTFGLTQSSSTRSWYAGVPCVAPALDVEAGLVITALYRRRAHRRDAGMSEALESQAALAVSPASHGARSLDATVQASS